MVNKIIGNEKVGVIGTSDTSFQQKFNHNKAADKQYGE